MAVVAQQQSSCPKGLRVLLCEGPQHQGCEETTALLQQLQHSVTQAADTQQLLDQLAHSSSEAECFDVCLVDADLLGDSLSSSSIAAEVFEAAASSGTALVLLTQPSHHQCDLLEAIQAGAADVLERPLCLEKLQVLQQHTALPLAGGSSSSPSTATHHMQHAAAAAEAPHSPEVRGLLDDCLDADALVGLDSSLGGLELPPLLPSQLELDALGDSLLSEMAAAAAEVSTAPLGGSLGQPSLAPSSPSHSNAATAVAASLFGSEQRCSSASQTAAATAAAAAASTELESCADACSAEGASSSRHKLRTCTSLRSMAVGGPAAFDRQDGCGCHYTAGWADASCDTAAAFMHPGMHMGAMNMNMDGSGGMNMNSSCEGPAVGAPWGSSGCWASASGCMPMSGPVSGVGMGAPMGMGMCAPLPPTGPLPLGMVWGMPVANVAVAPGIVPRTQRSAAAAGSSGPSNSSSTGSRKRASVDIPVTRAAAAAASSSNRRRLSLDPFPAAPVAPAVPQSPFPATPVAPAVPQSAPMPMPAQPPMWAPMWGGMWPPMCYPMAPPVQQNV